MAEPMRDLGTALLALLPATAQQRYTFSAMMGCHVLNIITLIAQHECYSMTLRHTTGVERALTGDRLGRDEGDVLQRRRCHRRPQLRLVQTHSPIMQRYCACYEQHKQAWRVGCSVTYPRVWSKVQEETIPPETEQTYTEPALVKHR